MVHLEQVNIEQYRIRLNRNDISWGRNFNRSSLKATTKREETFENSIPLYQQVSNSLIRYPSRCGAMGHCRIQIFQLSAHEDSIER